MNAAFRTIHHPAKWLALALLAGTLVACGPESPEAELKDAAENVDKAEEKVMSARDDVVSAARSLEDYQEEVSRAEIAVAQAEKDLRRRQQQLAAERQELSSVASDAAIFRLLQKKLLDERSLNGAAVSVRVMDARVVLRGDVIKPEQRQIAEDIAAATPGVNEVVNLINIEAGPESSAAVADGSS